MTSKRNQRREPQHNHHPAAEGQKAAHANGSTLSYRTRARRYPILSIIAVAVAAWLAVGGMIYVSATGVEKVKSPSTAQILLDGMAKGPTNAKVQIIIYSDFQCPFCARFALTTAKQIEEVYVKKGLVRLEYRHYAFLGQESHWAAQASEAANEQGMFWPYHDKLMANQAGENKGAFSPQNLKRFAAELGLNQKAFDEALDSGKYANKVNSDSLTAKAAGVNRTPTFFINGRKLVGDQPFEVFQRIIEEELRK